MGSPKTSQFNYILSCGLGVFCRVAVNGFYMISGYFICKNTKEITVKYVYSRVFKQYKKIWIYSNLIFLAAVLCGIRSFSIDGLLSAMMPVMSNMWWFATVFMLLTCIKPFAEKLLIELKDNELKVLICCICFFDTIQSVLGSNAFGERGSGILHAVYMLLIGYTLRRFKCFDFSWKKGVGLYVVSCLLAGVFSLFEKKIFLQEDARAVIYNSPFIVSASIGFFIAFAKGRCLWTWPKKIAPYVFAIYLINDHPYIREIAWNQVLHCDSFYGSNFMIFHWLFSVAAFALVGIGIDWLIESVEKYIWPIRKEKYNE